LRRFRAGELRSCPTDDEQEDRVQSKRVVALASGSGTLLQALLDAVLDPTYGAQVVAVGSDRPGIAAFKRAEAAGVPGFVVAPAGYADRKAWDIALAEAVTGYLPDLVVSVGFARIIGEPLLSACSGRIINTHPALLPAFPGAHAVADALAYGVRITGATVHFADAGVDSGPVIAQRAVEVAEDDDESTLHERIKTVERVLLVDVVGRLVRYGWTVQGRKVTIE
jgi:phosphoribosylglycinamide formyltransferase-1